MRAGLASAHLPSSRRTQCTAVETLSARLCNTGAVSAGVGLWDDLGRSAQVDPSPICELSYNAPPSKGFPSRSRHVAATNERVYPYPVDPVNVSKILAANDWFPALNAEFNADRSRLNPQYIVKVLRLQENPVHALKFYAWVSNFSCQLAKDASVGMILKDVLWRKGPVLLSESFLTEFKSSGCQFTEDLFCFLIGSWGRLGLAKYVSEVFGQMSFVGFRPSTRIYNAVISALVKSNSLDLAYFKFQQMPADNCLPDRFTYHALIHGVCKLGITDEALRLLKQMESSGHPPNDFTYTMLTDGFCRAKKVEEAFQILDTMRKRNIFPSSATFRSLIYGAFMCLSPQKAFVMVSQMLELERAVQDTACNVLLYCASKNSLAIEAREFLRKMSPKGYIPDRLTFHIVMICLLKGLDLPEVCLVFDGFVTMGGKPNFDTYLALITALHSGGRVEDGDRLVNHMLSQGLACSVMSYNMLIDVYCKTQLMDKALELFETMIHKGFVPNLVSFNTLISGYAKVRQADRMKELLKRMFMYGLTPDVYTFSSIIDGLCHANQIEDAFNCYSEMAEWGVSPNIIIYNILLRSLCWSGNIQKARKMFLKMESEGVKPDIFSYNALISAFCKMKQTEKAQNLLESMLSFGVSPDNYTFNVFTKALCDQDRITEAKEFVQAMEANGCIPNSESYTLIIDALACKRKFEDVHELLHECERRGIHVVLSPTTETSISLRRGAVQQRPNPS